MSKRIVTLPWVRANDYEEVRRTMEDKDEWPTSYQDWLDQAEDEAVEAERKGNQVFRIMIEPYEFEVWCAANDMKKDSAGRHAFASEYAKP